MNRKCHKYTLTKQQKEKKRKDSIEQHKTKLTSMLDDIRHAFYSIWFKHYRRLWRSICSQIRFSFAFPSPPLPSPPHHTPYNCDCLISIWSTTDNNNGANQWWPLWFPFYTWTTTTTIAIGSVYWFMIQPCNNRIWAIHKTLLKLYIFNNM